MAHPGENPHVPPIEACNDNPAEIQNLYHVHRTKRNSQQRDKFLSPNFDQLVIDPYLLRLENKAEYPGFVDDRNGYCLWARPPNHVLKLAEHLQKMLQEAAPHIWLMPSYCMHMTALELIHSRTPEYTLSSIASIRAHIPELANYTFTHRARLVKPMISYDLSAFAVSFLPAHDEPYLSPDAVAPNPAIPLGASAVHRDPHTYTYQHLRRDLWSAARRIGAEVESRYQVPSAHITLGRYLGHQDHQTPEMRERWVKAIDEINAWLEREVWGVGNGEFVGEWVVGQEKGLDCRAGALWYGGGRTVMLGEGF